MLDELFAESRIYRMGEISGELNPSAISRRLIELQNPDRPD